MKKIILLGIISLAFGLAGFLSIHQAFGNPSFAPKVDNCQWDRLPTSLGSSTIRYMTAGTATTTLTCDAYSLSANSPSGDLMDSAILNIQFSASGTASTLFVDFEYANVSSNGANCVASPGACDWLENSLDLGIKASTTRPFAIDAKDTLRWRFASTTIGTGTAPGNIGYKIVNVPTPARYIRAVFSLPVGSGRGGVWSELLPKKQR